MAAAPPMSTSLMKQHSLEGGVLPFDDNLDDPQLDEDLLNELHDIPNLSSPRTSDEATEADIEGLATPVLGPVTPQVSVPKLTPGGKPIAAKTSIYRGVTKTSNKGWGAKYSSRRITSTCKTEEEAARAYDEYLRHNVPEKYEKYCNFCSRCGGYRNSLRLKSVTRQCPCPEIFATSTPVPSSPAISESTVSTISTDPYDSGYTTHSPAYSSPPEYTTPINELDPIEEMRESGDDLISAPVINGGTAVDGPHDDSMFKLLDAVTDADLCALIKHEPIEMDQTNQKPILSSAASLELDDDIAEMLLRSSSGRVDYLNYQNIQQQSQNAYLEQMLKNSAAMGGQVSYVPVTYITTPNAASMIMASTTSSTNSQAVYLNTPHGTVQDTQPTAFQHSVMPTLSLTDEDIAHLSDTILGAEQTQSTQPPWNSAVGGANVALQLETQFWKKYWRNDRKNIQCFPFCPEFGDYYTARVQNLKHKCKGVCRAPVIVKAMIQAPLALENVLLIGQVVVESNYNELERKTLAGHDIAMLQNTVTFGVVKNVTSADGRHITAMFEFLPAVWKFEDELPKNKKRRQPHETDETECKYFFRVDAFCQQPDKNFAWLNSVTSPPFEFGSTRTLLRHKHKLEDDAAVVAETFDDSNYPLMVELAENEVHVGIMEEGHPSKRRLTTRLGQATRKSNSFELPQTDANGAIIDGSQESTQMPYGHYKSPANAGKSSPEPSVAVVHQDRSLRTEMPWEVQLGSSTFSLLLYSMVIAPFFSAVSTICVLCFALISLCLMLAAGLGCYTLLYTIEFLDVLGRVDLRLCNSFKPQACDVVCQRRIDPQEKRGLKRLTHYLGDSLVQRRLMYYCGGKLLFSVVLMFVTPVILIFRVLGSCICPQPLSRTLNLTMYRGMQYSYSVLGDAPQTKLNDSVQHTVEHAV